VGLLEGAIVDNEGFTDGDCPVEGFDESEDGMDDEEGSLDGVLSIQQMRRVRGNLVHSEEVLKDADELFKIKQPHGPKKLPTVREPSTNPFKSSWVAIEDAAEAHSL
jgi:hypothetical protein